MTLSEKHPTVSWMREALEKAGWHKIGSKGIAGVKRFHNASDTMIEVVRCYEDEYTVFITRDGTVCACPFPKPSTWPEQFRTHQEAKACGQRYFQALQELTEQS